MVKMTVPEVLIREKGKGGRFFMLRGSYPSSPAAGKKKEIPQYIGVKKLRSSPLPPLSLLNSLYGNGRKLQCPNLLLLLLPPSLMPKVLFCVSAAPLSFSPSPQEEEEKLLR